jgi:hypothetical protein
MAAEGWQRHGTPASLASGVVGLSARQLALAGRLLKKLISLRPMRWSTLGSLAKGSSDRVDVEHLARELWHRGWIEICFRRDRKGESKPTQLRLREDAVLLASAQLDLESAQPKHARIAALVKALQAREPGLPPVPERVLVRQVFGNTKAARLRTYRAELEALLGVPLETLVRFHVDSVLTAGPVTFRFRGVTVDLRGSTPWAAITGPVVSEIDGVRLDGVDELVCVENQTPFESLLYQGLAKRAVVVFTAGYMGAVERGWLAHLIRAGVRRVRHWGDMDPWGLDIYRDIRDHVLSVDSTVQVEAWKMSPELLERSETVNLSPEDWVRLHRILADPDAPLREAALAMKRLKVKLEQEVLLQDPWALGEG